MECGAAPEDSVEESPCTELTQAYLKQDHCQCENSCEKSTRKLKFRYYSTLLLLTMHLSTLLLLTMHLLVHYYF